MDTSAPPTAGAPASKESASAYTVVRRFTGGRTAEEVAAALIKAHS